MYMDIQREVINFIMLGFTLQDNIFHYFLALLKKKQVDETD